MPIVKNIQALRALGAYLIVFRHLQELLWRGAGESLLFASGEAGVDLFFVISGFIMVYTTAGKQMTPREFACHRVVRVVPLYWLVTLVVFSLAFIAPWAAGATRSDPVDLLKSLLFVPFEKGNGKIRPVVFVGWTLNYEMFFYLLFTVALFVKKRTAALVGVVGVLVTLILGGALFHPAGALGKFYTDSILLEFAFGVIIGSFCSKISGARSSYPFAFLAVLLGLAALFVRPYLWSEVPRAFAYGIPAAVIVAAVINLEGNGFGLKSRMVQFLGAASYSIYLTHFFVTLFFVRLGARLHVGSLVVTIGLILSALVAVAVVGGLTHVYVERRFTDWGRASFFTGRNVRVTDAGEVSPGEKGVV